MPDVCTVRPMEEADLAMVLAWRNHPDVYRYMITQHQISEQEHKEWYSRAIMTPSRHLLIVQEAAQPLGYVQFSSATIGGVAEWGFYSSPGAPKGSGRKIGTAALNYAFSELQLHKVCGQALAFNERSIAFHQRLGFVQEGVLRDQHRIKGIYHNLICFGLLKTEWARSETMRNEKHA
jgi:UDP-4-amino-4,6-dideoxy-N-acetyl-beta-L-altrosamine N-acetyltransferase